MGDHYEQIVEMYEESIFVSTLTKQGYDRVLERIDPLMCKWAMKTYMPGYTFDDIKQELSLIIIEGINSFDPSKKVKLSSFLHTHLKYKLLSKLKSVNKLSNDAYSLKPSSALCSCGGVIKVVETFAKCYQCGSEHNISYRKSREELIFSAMPKTNPGSGEEYAEFESSLSESDNLYRSPRSNHDAVDLKMAISSLRSTVDDKTFQILKMVCLEGYSIKDAGQSVGLTGWAASMRLKKLDRNRVIRDLLSDYIETSGDESY